MFGNSQLVSSPSLSQSLSQVVTTRINVIFLFTCYSLKYTYMLSLQKWFKSIKHSDSRSSHFQCSYREYYWLVNIAALSWLLFLICIYPYSWFWPAWTKLLHLLTLSESVSPSLWHKGQWVCSSRVVSITVPPLGREEELISATGCLVGLKIGSVGSCLSTTEMAERGGVCAV